MLYGYHSRYLLIDLTSQSSEARELSEPELRAAIGGVGLGTALLHKHTTSAALSNPLHPDAPLVFAFSPLVGSPLTTSAKFSVVAQSPLTQRINDSLSSSHFALAGKRTGYDAICLVGRSAAPTCLLIHEDSTQFLPADELWGMTIPRATEAIRNHFGADYRAALIGPAGERHIPFATISNDGRHAGRGGHGAVLGSKNIKAVLVRGDRRTSFAHPLELNRFAKELSRRSFGPATAKYRELGTVSNLLTFNRLGVLPTRNFQSSEFHGASEIAPESLASEADRVRASCAACTIGCEHIFPSQGKAGGVRMEYENLYALGPLCGIADPQAVLSASALCDEYGLDTISTGATIAFAMECAQRGLLNTQGLLFGNATRLLETIHDIAHRRGLGELLSLGSRQAAAALGPDAEELVVHVKGLELPGYEPRALQAMALGFAVGTRGADHNRSGAYEVDFSPGSDRQHLTQADIERVIRIEDEAALMDSLILCKFLRGVFEDRLIAFAEMLNLVTGCELNALSIRELGAAIVTDRKRFNVRAGWTPAEDTLPGRFFDNPIPSGPAAGAVITQASLQARINLYNQLRGWSTEGYPPAAE